MLLLDPNEKLKLDDQESLFPTLTSPKTTLEKPTAFNIDSLFEYDRIRKICLQSSMIKITNLILLGKRNTVTDSITSNRDPTLDNEFAKNKYFDDELDKN